MKFDAFLLMISIRKDGYEERRVDLFYLQSINVLNLHANKLFIRISKVTGAWQPSRYYNEAN